MFIIAGLGNPTLQYEGTRHNAGFDVIDTLAGKYNISVDGRKNRALIGKGIIEGKKVILAKPQTYMNLSGESLGGLVDVVKLLSQLLEEFYPSFVDKNLSYELQSNVPVKVITADGNLLARLFDNLINNAIKYGADGKRIMVKLHADDEIVTVSVINYGYVIPADELPLIFNKFYRVEQSRSTNTGGTGLGLAISKNIVDMHGGTITVTSDLSGTVFTVKLKVNFDVNKENFGKIG